MTRSQGRQTARQQAAREEALDHAQAVVAESGAGAVTVSEIARRMGMRAPSLYKYFPSLHAIYDGLFERGNVLLAAHVDEAVRDLGAGLERALETCRSISQWGMEEQGLAPLMFWRPIPGFEPSPEAFRPAEALVRRTREDLAVAVRSGDLARAADSDEAMRLLTSITAGLCSQQLANQPGVSFEEGVFTSLIDEALEMFVQYYAPHPRKRTGT
jgi:AcrR family transcriptional regulator